MKDWKQHLKLAMRQLWRDPGFIVTVLLTLTFSIGANTAIFSLANALMLKKLPYPQPERMGTIYTRISSSTASDARHRLNGEQWELLRDGVPRLISAVSASVSGVNLQAASGAEYVQNGRVSAHYFDVLSLRPFIGRNFSEDEDRPSGPRVAILAYNLWHKLFDARGDILGQKILLKGEAYTVVGVLPQDAIAPLNADMYTPLQPGRKGEGSGTNFDVIMRLRDGATWQEANSEINRAWALRADPHELRINPGSQVTYYSVPLQKAETDALRPRILVLTVAAVFILMIACANLAALTIVRMLRRTSEVATRLALGASYWQIQKQFWIESLLLALVAGSFAVGVAHLALRGFFLLLPQHFFPIATVPLDRNVLAFTFVVSMLATVLFGIFPTFAIRRVDLRSALGRRSIVELGSVRLRQTLITGEIALTFVLLAASALLIRSLIHLETLPSGFNPDGVITAKASLDDFRFHDPAAFRKLLDDSIATMRQIPGVQNAAVGLSLPYERALNEMVTVSDGKEAGRQGSTDVIYVTAEYFRALQIPVLAGRVFTEADSPTTQRVAIVNQTFVRRFYGGSNPVGRFINKDTLIVGEVADVPVSSGLYAGAPLMNEQAMYIPAAQVDAQQLTLIHVWFQPNWIVRTAGRVEGLRDQMQRALTRANPNLPGSGIYSMNDLLARTLVTQRIEVALLTAMAALAVLLSAVGIFGLVANMVAQRTREIGVRMALGSTIGKAMMQVGESGTRASLLGVVLGLILSVGVLRTMRSAVYGIYVYDASTLAVVVLTLVGVTLLAIIVPTLKIAWIDPAITLREA